MSISYANLKRSVYNLQKVINLVEKYVIDNINVFILAQYAHCKELAHKDK